MGLIPYYVIYGILLFLALGEMAVFRKKHLVRIVFTALAIFLAIRFQVGNDYAEYYMVLKGISAGTIEIYFEPGFLFLYSLVNNPEYFIAILSLISLFLLYKTFMFFETRYIFTALLLYFSVYFIIFNIHLIRQGFSIALVLYSFIYLYKKSYVRCVLLVLLAGSIHKSAFIVLPFLAIVAVDLKKNHRLLIVGLAILVFIVLTYFKQYVFMALALFPPTQRFAIKYNNEIYSGAYGISLGLLFDILLFLFINSRKNLSKKENFLMNIFLFSVFLSIAFNNFSIALRLGYYFRVVNVFLFLYLARIRPRWVFYTFLIVYTSYYLHNNLYKGNAVLEYRTIFTMEE